MKDDEPKFPPRGWVSLLKEAVSIFNLQPLHTLTIMIFGLLALLWVALSKIPTPHG